MKWDWDTYRSQPTFFVEAIVRNMLEEQKEHKKAMSKSKKR